jgi:hypothetical protein
LELTIKDKESQNHGSRTPLKHPHLTFFAAVISTDPIRAFPRWKAKNPVKKLTICDLHLLDGQNTRPDH